MKINAYICGVVAASVALGFSMGVQFQKNRVRPTKVVRKTPKPEPKRHCDVSDPTPEVGEKEESVRKNPISLPEPDDNGPEDYTKVFGKKMPTPEELLEEELTAMDEDPPFEYFKTFQEWNDHPYGYGVLSLNYYEHEDVLADNFDTLLPDESIPNTIGEGLDMLLDGYFTEEGIAYIRNNQRELDIRITPTTEAYAQARMKNNRSRKKGGKFRESEAED